MGGKGSGGYRGKEAMDKARAANPVLQGQDPANCDKGNNSASIRFAMELMKLGPVDLSDADATRERIAEYLRICDEQGMKPMVNSMSSALGLDRKYLWLVYNGEEWAVRKLRLTPETLLLLQKAYQLLQVIWEGNLAQETGSPLKWFFFGKNHFGYTDTTEVVHRKVERPAIEGSAEEVAERYAAIAGREAKRLPAEESAVEVEVEPSEG